MNLMRLFFSMYLNLHILGLMMVTVRFLEVATETTLPSRVNGLWFMK